MKEKGMRFSVWFPVDLRNKVKEIADNEDRSINYIIIRMVRDGVKKHENEKI